MYFIEPLHSHGHTKGFSIWLSSPLRHIRHILPKIWGGRLSELFIDTEIVFCLLFSNVLISVFFDLFFFVNFALIFLFGLSFTFSLDFVSIFIC